MIYNSSSVFCSVSDVSTRIDTIRRNLGLSQGQFANALQISQPAVSKYLRERIPPAEILLRVAHLGNTTIEWLLCGQKNYFFREPVQRVDEPEIPYGPDIDLKMARKIARLPSHARDVIDQLINLLLADQK